MIHPKSNLLLHMLAWLIICGATALYIKIAFLQYVNIRNGIDLATYTQLLYNLSSFHHFPPYNTILDRIAWGDHAHFITIFLAPLFALYPKDITLIIIQIVAITSSAWALFDIAQRRFQNAFYSYAVLFSYLLFFGIQYAIGFDFHTNVLTAGFLAWLFWAFERKYFITFWVLLFFTLITREDAPLFTGAFGMYVVIANMLPLLNKERVGGEVERKRFVAGVITLLISALYFYILTYMIMPLWEPHNTTLPYFDIDKRIVLHPVKLAQNMFDSSIKIRTMKNLFASFGFLPLASPFTYLASIPNFLARFLSSEDQRWDMKMHYSASLVSILSYGSILGTAMILRVSRFFFSGIRRVIPAHAGIHVAWIPDQVGDDDKQTNYVQKIILSICAILLICGTYTTSLHDADLPIVQFISNKNIEINPDAVTMRARLEQLEQTIPKQDNIEAISSFTPIFAVREHVTFIRGNAPTADWIILSNLYFPWPLSGQEINTYIRAIRVNPNYTSVIQENGLYVFKKK